MSVKEKRTRRSAAQWRKLIGEQRDSGMSQKAFCDRRGLGMSTFARWKARLATPDEEVRDAGERGELIELVAPPSAGGERLALELDLGGGMVLRIHRG